MYNDYVISSGHWKNTGSGANYYLNEVTEARRVVDKVASYIKQIGCDVDVFHDNTSTSKNQNLATIVNYHNSRKRNLDVSIHFNAASPTTAARGTEVYGYNTSTKDIGSKVSSNIASAGGFKNRGFKTNSGFYFLKNTNQKALLIEICFVDSKADADLYNKNFDAICRAIAETLTGKKIPAPVVTPSNSTFKVGTYQKDVVVTADSLNVRSGRGTEFSIIGSFSKNTKVNVWYIDKAKDGSLWGSCGISGKTGYIHMGYVKPV